MKLDLGAPVPLAFSPSPKRNLQQELLLRLSRIQRQVPGVLMGLRTLHSYLRRAP